MYPWHLVCLQSNPGMTDSWEFFFSSTEVDDMIRKSTNLLLTRTLSNSLQNVIKRKNIGLTEVKLLFMEAAETICEPCPKLWGLFVS